MTAAQRPEGSTAASPPPPRRRPPRSHPRTGRALEPPAPKQSHESRFPSLSPTTARARTPFSPRSRSRSLSREEEEQEDEAARSSAAAAGSAGSRLATRAHARSRVGPPSEVSTSHSLRQRSAPAESRKRDDSGDGDGDGDGEGEEAGGAQGEPKTTAVTRAGWAPMTLAEGGDFELLLSFGDGGQPLTTTTALWQAKARAEPSRDQEAAEEVYLFFFFFEEEVEGEIFLADLRLLDYRSGFQNRPPQSPRFAPVGRSRDEDVPSLGVADAEGGRGRRRGNGRLIDGGGGVAAVC